MIPSAAETNPPSARAAFRCPPRFITPPHHITNLDRLPRKITPACEIPRCRQSGPRASAPRLFRRLARVPIIGGNVQPVRASRRFGRGVGTWAARISSFARSGRIAKLPKSSRLTGRFPFLVLAQHRFSIASVPRPLVSPFPTTQTTRSVGPRLPSRAKAFDKSPPVPLG